MDDTVDRHQDCNIGKSVQQPVNILRLETRYREERNQQQRYDVVSQIVYRAYAVLRQSDQCAVGQRYREQQDDPRGGFPDSVDFLQHRNRKCCSRQQRRQTEQGYRVVDPFVPVGDTPQLRGHRPDQQSIGDQVFRLQQRQQEGGE